MWEISPPETVRGNSRISSPHIHFEQVPHLYLSAKNECMINIITVMMSQEKILNKAERRNGKLLQE